MIRAKLAVASAWIGLCVVVLAYTLMTPTSPETREKGLFFVWAMLILTFPSGVVLSTIGALLAPLVAPDVRHALSTSALGFVTGWCAFVACGYFQWFVVLPTIGRRFSQWRTDTVESIVRSQDP